MAREFTRGDRIAAQLQRELAELVRAEIHDSRMGMVTISDVEVTRDLSLAKAYVSFMGGTETPQVCLKLLAEHIPGLRRALSARIRIRVMPELRFIHDDSIERGDRMDKIFLQLGAGNDRETAPEDAQ